MTFIFVLNKHSYGPSTEMCRYPRYRELTGNVPRGCWRPSWLLCWIPFGKCYMVLETLSCPGVSPAVFPQLLENEKKCKIKLNSCDGTFNSSCHVKIFVIKLLTV